MTIESDEELEQNDFGAVSHDLNLRRIVVEISIDYTVEHFSFEENLLHSFIDHSSIKHKMQFLILSPSVRANQHCEISSQDATPSLMSGTQDQLADFITGMRHMINDLVTEFSRSVRRF